MKQFSIWCAALLPLSGYSQQVSDPLLGVEAQSSFKTLISHEEIEEAIKHAAAQIDRDLNGEEVSVIVVLKGAMFLAVDLIRQIQSPSQMECIRASSYGLRGASRGQLTVEGLEELDLKGKNVLVVEDIFDTGVTLSSIIHELQKLQPKTLRSLVLLMKNVEHLTDYRPDYSLFEVENHFVIGYGLDYKEYWRNLNGVYIAQ